MSKKTAAAAPTTIGQRISSVRKAWGWSQEDMARVLRVDQASISFWEHDKVDPSGTSHVAIAALFGVSLDALTTGGDGWSIPVEPAALPAFQPQLEAIKKTK